MGYAVSSYFTALYLWIGDPGFVAFHFDDNGTGIFPVKSVTDNKNLNTTQKTLFTIKDSITMYKMHTGLFLILLNCWILFTLLCKITVFVVVVVAFICLFYLTYLIKKAHFWRKCTQYLCLPLKVFIHIDLQIACFEQQQKYSFKFAATNIAVPLVHTLVIKVNNNNMGRPRSMLRILQVKQMLRFYQFLLNWKQL